jgi:hypothetical protein
LKLHERMISPENVNKKSIIIMKFDVENNLPPMSLLIQHSKQGRKRRHLNNGYQSNHQDCVIHQHRVNRQKQHRLEVNCIVHEANKYALMNFHKVFLDIMHLQVVSPTEIIHFYYEIILSLSYYFNSQ